MIVPDLTYYERGLQLKQAMQTNCYAPLTFDQYCSSQGFSGERGRQLIAAARVHDQLSTTGAILLPALESQLRPLTTLPESRVVEVWNLISTLSPDAIRTTEMIESVVDAARRNPDQPLRYVSAADLPDAAYPSDNDFDIPLLLLESQATAADLPFLLWGSVSRRTAAGTYHFYTDDSRFSALIGDPTPVINSGCTSAVECNLSLYGQLPRAVALSRIYHKRYVSRTWQGAGIGVFVDLNVAPLYAEWNLIGVPVGWKSYATRGNTDRIEDTINEYEIACYHAGSREILFVVYGGGKDVQTLATANGWIYFPEFMSRSK